MKKHYECPVCEGEVLDPGDMETVVTCECGARLRIDYDADGDSEGYRDCSAFLAIGPIGDLLDERDEFLAALKVVLAAVICARNYASTAIAKAQGVTP